MKQYLKEKWLHLRMYRAKSSFMIDYRILRNTAKLIGMKKQLN